MSHLLPTEGQFLQKEQRKRVGEQAGLSELWSLSSGELQGLGLQELWCGGQVQPLLVFLRGVS